MVQHHCKALSEEQADALEFMQHAIHDALDSDPLVLNLEIERYTLDRISAAEFFATEPIDLNYLTFGGDEYFGAAEPPSPV